MELHCIEVRQQLGMLPLSVLHTAALQRLAELQIPGGGGGGSGMSGALCLGCPSLLHKGTLCSPQGSSRPVAVASLATPRGRWAASKLTFSHPTADLRVSFLKGGRTWTWLAAVWVR